MVNCPAEIRAGEDDRSNKQNIKLHVLYAIKETPTGTAIGK